ncbi:RNA ligase [compost metagenome]
MSIFPLLSTVDPLLNAVANMPEIAVHEDVENGYGFVMYQVAFEETFADPELADTPEERERRLLVREARGVKYDLVTRQVVSRPYHKFFNIGEKLETQPNKIDWSKNHVILEKLDGSMLTPLWKASTREILWMTKRGVTSVAGTAQQFLKDNPQYDAFCRAMTDAGWSPIFEWCTRKQRIIIDYGVKDRMVLTAIRNNITGEYTGYDEMVAVASQWGLDYVRKLPYKVTDVDKFINDVRALEGEEGYIVRFDDGSMFKIKGEWYCRIHRTFDNLRFEKDVIRLILSGDLDDAKPFLVPTLVSAVDRFHKDMIKVLRKTASELFWYVTASKDNLNGSKKKFAEQTMSNEWEPYKGIAFHAWDREMSEEELFERLISDMISATGSQGSVNKSRFLIGGLMWKDYLDGDDDAE